MSGSPKAISMSLTLSAHSSFGIEFSFSIFVVLICGLILAVFVAVMEFVWSTRHSGSDEVHTPLHHPSSSSGHAHCQHTPVGYRGNPPTSSVCASVVS